MIKVFSTHPWFAIALGLGVMVGLFLVALAIRKRRILENAQGHKSRAEARERGSHTARLQYPAIDLTQCIGCGACVRACPEEGVLALLHGQAAIVHGARCVGHAMCASACPTGAISLTLGDLSQRRDMPAVTADLQAAGVPGLFIAGELSGFALVRTAISHGVAVADAVAYRTASQSHGRTHNGTSDPDEVINLLIVGAGPGGLACSLRAKELGLRFLTIDQEPRLGGTVAAYPRKKLVMTQPVELPLYGRLSKLSYEKEELVALWEEVTAKNQLPIHMGVKLDDLSRDSDGCFVAKTTSGTIRAHNVCMALGRRGSPRRLAVPGEDLPKVSYSLLDAASYQNRNVLVVGGGDSAVEAAIGLAEQPGITVTLSYRKAAFFRLKSRNDARINKAIHQKKLRVLFNSQVESIDAESATVRVDTNAVERLANDFVFILVGGEPPFALLERAGVSFDPADRPTSELLEPSKDSGLLNALSLTGVCTIITLLWAVRQWSYYRLDYTGRLASPLHGLLRPGAQIGLAAGLVACLLFLWNLAYLIRRSTSLGKFLPGTLRRWMGWHVFTGLTGVLCVVVHSGFSMRSTTGGHALIVLAAVVLSGAIGRYFYAFVPRAANGTESSLDELRKQLTLISTDWDRDRRGFGTQVHEQIDHLITDGRWRPGFFARIGVLIVGQFRLRRSLRKLKRVGSSEGFTPAEIDHVLVLAKRAYRLTLLVTHYEEVGALLASWRYFHRWLALLMVLLAIAHIVIAARYASLDFSFLPFNFGGSR